MQFLETMTKRKSSLQGRSDRKSIPEPKASNRATSTESLKAMANSNGSSVLSISSSLCVESDFSRPSQLKKLEDEKEDVHSLLEPSPIDLLGIGSQVGGHICAPKGDIGDLP